MNFTAKDVSDLRAQTGIGMMECKKALTEANGDKEEAIKILREKGLAVAEKKASRIAAEGVVDILAQGDSVAMVAVSYTHLDVYKRQPRCRPWRRSRRT